MKIFCQKERNFTPYEELVKLVKEGNLFMFLVALALNKGYRNVLKKKYRVKFSIGNYDVEFNAGEMCFMITNRIYFGRIIRSYFDEAVFIGDSEEVINELLDELEKEHYGKRN